MDRLAIDAAKAATSTIPIVFATNLDPVKLGPVASLNRPGGNLTGVALITSEILGKQLDLLHQMVPRVTIFGYSLIPGSGHPSLINGSGHSAVDTLNAANACASVVSSPWPCNAIQIARTRSSDFP